MEEVFGSGSPAVKKRRAFGSFDDVFEREGFSGGNAQRETGQRLNLWPCRELAVGPTKKSHFFTKM